MVNYKIKVDNVAAKMQYPVYINNNRLYVSLRDICNQIGMSIEWNDEEKTAEIRRGSIDTSEKGVIISGKTEFRKEGAIPDEKTALAVGKAILEEYAERPLEYTTDKRIYYLRASLIEENTWLVVQNFKYLNPNSGGSTDFAEFAHVKLNKNTGEVMYINTHSTYID